MGCAHSVLDEWRRARLAKRLAAAFSVSKHKTAADRLPREQRIIIKRLQEVFVREQMILFPFLLQEQAGDKAHVSFYNYSDEPLQLLQVDPSGRLTQKCAAAGSCEAVHIRIDLAAFSSASLVSGWDGCTLTHALLKQKRRIRVQTRPHNRRPWKMPAAQALALGDTFTFVGRMPFELLQRGEHASAAMDAETWSVLPRDLVLTQILPRLSTFDKAEFSLVSKEWRDWFKSAASSPSPSRCARESWVLLRVRAAVKCPFFFPEKHSLFLIAWCPSSNMVFQLPPDHPVLSSTDPWAGRTYRNVDVQELMPKVRQLERGMLTVKVGSSFYETRLEAWICKRDQIWLTFYPGTDCHGQQWDGDLWFLDCSRLGETDTLAAAFTSSDNRLQWVGIWELQQGSYVWEQMAILSPETEPSIWNQELEARSEDLSALIQDDLVVVTHSHGDPIVFHIPSRTWKSASGRAFDRVLPGFDPLLPWATFPVLQASVEDFVRGSTITWT